MRTVSAPGRLVKRTGASRTTASPSRPAGTGPSDRTSKAGTDHWSREPRSRPWPGSNAATPSGRCPSAAAFRRRRPEAGRGCWRRGCTAPDVCSRPSGPSQRRSSGLPPGPSVSGTARCDRAQLRLPVALPLDRFRVDPERDVVHEHAAVDLREVDASLPPIDQRVERADDVVAVDARGPARSGCASRPGCTRRAARARRRPWRRSPACRRRRPPRAHRRRAPPRRATSASRSSPSSQLHRLDSAAARLRRRGLPSRPSRRRTSGSRRRPRARGGERRAAPPAP